MIVTDNNIEHTRAQMCQRRRALGIGAQYRAAYHLYQQLQNHPSFGASQSVACYWAMPGELSCLWVIKALWRSGKRCYLPVIDFSVSPKAMVFKEYRPGDRLVKNRYGIAEPIAGQTRAAEQLDCILVPLTAFDDKGHRIGMGGGFYDRTFESARLPSLLGVAYGFQRVMRIVPQPWDIVLDDVIAV